MAFMVRQEEPKDFHEVEDVIEEAFRGMEMSDHKEQAVVGKLRVSDAYVPELALVAEGEDGKIVGHALLSEVLIRSGDQALRSLSLAPVSVLPEFQKQGVGSALIEEGLKRARELDYGSVIVLGNP
ncbi:GNAT family N-acetyltransferase [Bhargavaea cecembensis]|uniref:GNAT family N-acetyltransferase n=1 Tax=Bhargavaea cecembensis TaxID=394098 RepID=UPI000AE15FCF|nr:N-acetyltransferase [Bhargavaea cecembensis]